jgi:hypothetical protein
MNSLTDLPQSLAAHEFRHLDKILKPIGKFDGEQDIDKRIQLLKFINPALPEEIQLTIPSLVTEYYVESALYNIETVCKDRIN